MANDVKRGPFFSCNFLHKEARSGNAVAYIQLDREKSYTEALEVILDKIDSIPVEICTGREVPEEPTI